MDRLEAYNTVLLDMRKHISKLKRRGKGVLCMIEKASAGYYLIKLESTYKEVMLVKETIRYVDRQLKKKGVENG